MKMSLERDIPPDQVCPDCGNFAYVEDGGAGRWFWRCETCRYETEVVPANYLLESWLFTVKDGRYARYYY